MTENKIEIQIDPEIKDFLPEYLENRKKDVETINEKLKQNDLEGIRIIGHKMKGSGELFGLKKISEIGHSIEEAAKTNNCELIEKLSEELKIFLAEIVRQISI